MDKPNYCQRNRDVLLNKSKEYYRNNTERIKNKSLPEDKKKLNIKKNNKKNINKKNIKKI